MRISAGDASCQSKKEGLSCTHLGVGERDEVARRVKLADLEDNSRPSRAILRPDRIEPDIGRVRKYLLAYKFLTDILTEEQYRAAMRGGG